VRGKGYEVEENYEGEYVLQGWVEKNGMAHFEKSYKDIPKIFIFDGQLTGKSIKGTWTSEG
jgi:hypothetical protein